MTFRCVGGLSACQLAAGQQSTGGELHVRRAAVADLVQLWEKDQHPTGHVLPLFKLALGDGAVRKSHAVPPQYRLHGETEGFVEQVVLFAPCGKVLAAVHQAWQGAGYGKGRQGHFLVGEKPEHRRYDGGQSLCPSLWQRNVQPRKSSSCLLACGILFLAVLYILFSSFFAYFLFPIHYTLIFQGCKSYQSMRSFLTHKKTDALVIHHSEGIREFDS